MAGGAREVESEPAVSLWLGAGLGPVETFAMEFTQTSSGGAYGGYRFPRAAAGVHLMICDPFTFPADGLLAHLNEQVPGAMVMGGMASAALGSRQSRLFLDDRVLSRGAVGVHLPGAEVHPLVAQGCRPVGDAYIITGAEGNVIHELGGRPPLVRLQEMAAALPGRDQELLAQGVLLGVVIDEYRAEPGQGDFLIRGLVGADPESGAVAVGDEIQVGQTVQFHVRDAASADADLRRALERESAALGGRRPAGALLFTCNGRGSRMFSEPDHDAGLIATMLGDIPDGRVLLRRRTRTGRRAELPAHLHRLDRAVPGPWLKPSRAGNPMVSVASASVSSHMKPAADDSPASARPTESSVHMPSAEPCSAAWNVARIRGGSITAATPPCTTNTSPVIASAAGLAR